VVAAVGARTWQRVRPWRHHSAAVQAHSSASMRSSRCLYAASSSGDRCLTSCRVGGMGQQQGRVGAVQDGEPVGQVVAGGGAAWPPAGHGQRGGFAFVAGAFAVVVEFVGADEGGVRVALADDPPGGGRSGTAVVVGPAGRLQPGAQGDAGQPGRGQVGGIGADVPPAVPLADLGLAGALPSWVVHDQRCVDEQQRRVAADGGLDPVDGVGQGTGPAGVEDPAGGVEDGDAGLVGLAAVSAFGPGEVDADEPLDGDGDVIADGVSGAPVRVPRRRRRRDGPGREQAVGPAGQLSGVLSPSASRVTASGRSPVGRRSWWLAARRGTRRR
jgi:hypothetical protein